MSDYEVVRTSTATKFYQNGSLVYDSPLVGSGTWYPHLAVRDSAFHVVADYMAIKQYTPVEPIPVIQDAGTYKNVTVTNSGSETLINYQVKLDGDSLGVYSKTDSLAFEAGESPSSTYQKISEKIGTYFNTHFNTFYRFFFQLPRSLCIK
jgi:hypothetical protein